MKIFIDGEWLDKEDAKISVFDHGLLYGDGVFEGIRCYNGRIFKLHEHLQRLYNSAQAIYLNIPYTPEKFEKIIIEAVRLNQLHDAYIRVVATRGFGDLGLDMRKCIKPTIVVIAGKIELFAQEVYERGIHLITSSLRRTPHVCLSPAIKSLNYLNNILARAEAGRANAQEAILLNMEGYVTECSGDNIFYAQNGAVYTPPIAAGLLPGITRATVIEIVRKQIKLPLQESLFPVINLYQADEVFVTGTGAEIIGVSEIDRHKIGPGKPGKLTRHIEKLYQELTRRSGTPVYQEVTV